MGNIHPQRRNELWVEVPDWNTYYTAEWRSPRTKELDRHGGPGRPPVARGDSVTARLNFLEGALRKDQRRMKKVLRVDEKKKEKEEDAAPGPGDVILNTDLRAWKRSVSGSGAGSKPGSQDAAAQQHKEFMLLTKDNPEIRRRMLEQRQKMLEYAKGVNVVKGAPGIKPMNHGAVRSKVASNWKGEGGEDGSRDDDGEGEGDPWGGQEPPAEWRQRMHAARRRTMLVVVGLVRWQMAMARRPGPKRLPRVNSFSYYIPQVLRDEATRFIEEALAVSRIQQQQMLQEDATTHAQALALAGPPASVYNGGELPPVVPPVVSSVKARPRPPPPGLLQRRGLSDSGANSPAQAALSAAVAAATGGSMPVGLPPRPRPELLKSASGKSCLSASEILLDTEDPKPGSKPASAAPASGLLPSIHAPKFHGLEGPTPPDAMPPAAPRPPRGRLARSSPSPGRPPAMRRQSDSAAMVPAGIAAAAAAAEAGLHGGRRSDGSGRQRRSSRSGVKHRKSDTGAVRPRRRSSSNGDGPGSGSPYRKHGSRQSSNTNLAQGRKSGTGAASDGGGGGAAVNASWPPGRRKSDNPGGLPTAASAPVVDGSPGRLPRIAASGAAAVGSPKESSKPLTLAQARRAALLAEAYGSAPGSAGSGSGCMSDDGLQRGAGQSPSRLGRQRISNGGVSILDHLSSNPTSGHSSKDPSGGGAPSILTILTNGSGAGAGQHSPLASPLSYRSRRASLDLNSVHSGPNAAEPSGPSSFSPKGVNGALKPIPRSIIATNLSDSTAALISPTHSASSPKAPLPPLSQQPPPSISSPLRASVPQPSMPLKPLTVPVPPAGPKLHPTEPRARSGRSLTSPGTPLPEGEAGARMSKAYQLMGMYANRANATWAEGQQWTTPSVLPATEQEQFCASDAWLPYKLNVVKLLRSGGIVVHIDACEDSVVLADGSSVDLWTSDPWVLAQQLRPGSLPMSERIEGVPLGARVLQQLVLAVEGAAGREAVDKLTVVLAINDDQRNAVVADIIRSRSYGLKPDRLILTAQRKRCGYRYDKEAQAFLEDPTTPPQVLGSGYALCQLAWLGDAFHVSPEGECVMLMGRTLLEQLAEAKAEWLLCRRARDLALLGEEGALELAGLAFALYAADRHSGNMVVQAAPATSLTIPRAYDSTLLALKSPSRANSATGAPSPSAGTAPRQASLASAAAGVEGGGGAAGVCDLHAAELSSPAMVEVLNAVRKQSGHDGWVGLQRYLMHLPTLHSMLNTMGIFRPKLAVCGDVARLALEASDLTCDRRAACVAVQARSSPAILTSPNEVDDLIPLLLAQDRSAAFRHILAQTNEAAAAAAGILPADGPDASAAATGAARGPQVLMSKSGVRLVVFVASNDVTQLAVNLVLMMARPGRDVVHLVTVVHNSLQLTQGQQLVLKYLKQVSNAMIEAHAEVLVKGMSGLLEVMEGAVGKLSPQLVVMGSAALTMHNLSTASVMGSVTLSVLKRVSLPTLVVTCNSKHLVATGRRTSLRTMAAVDTTSRPMLNFLCSACMEPMRGDKLVLAAHHPTRQMTTQQQQTQRRLMDNFADIASSHRFHSASRLQLDGPVDRAFVSAVEDEHSHVVGVQVPLGTKGVPAHVLGLIRSCRGGVLVYRDAT